MYGIFTYIYHKHIGKYTIHGWYGIAGLPPKNDPTQKLHVSGTDDFSRREPIDDLPKSRCAHSATFIPSR